MKVSDEIIKVLDALAEKFGMAIDWTSSNIIPYIEQLCGRYIDYEIATSVVWIMFVLIGMVLSIYATRVMKRWLPKTDGMEIDNGYSWGCVGLGMFIGAVWLAVVPIVMTQIFDIITCLTFPEKIIIDELKYLIN